MQLEFAAVDRAAQALFGRELGGGRLEELRAEDAHAAATLGFRVKQRSVSRAQQPLGVASVYWEDAGAQAQPHDQFAAIDDERLLEALHQLLAPALDLIGRARLL